MERILNPIDFLKASVIFHDNEKIIMDEKELLNKEKLRNLLRGEMKEKEDESQNRKRA